MRLSINGEDYPVSDDSVADLLDLIFDHAVRNYKKIDLPLRVLFTPIARALVGQWAKQAAFADMAKLGKKDDPSVRLIEMILQFLEGLALESTITLRIDERTGRADLSFFHPLLSALPDDEMEAVELLKQVL